MPDIAQLQGLLARVREAKGEDRELDGRIMFGLFAKPCSDHGYIWPEDDPSWSFALRFEVSSKEARKGIRRETIEWQQEDRSWILMNSLRVPKLTASIDAAVGLVERMIPPECDWVVDRWGNASLGYVHHVNSGDDLASKKPAMALLAALLAALIAIEERAPGEKVAG